METIPVSDRREFIDAVMSEELPLSKEGADELYDIWEYRRRNGATDEFLVFVPEWMADNDFGRQWPYMFAEVEYDDPDKGAVLFRDVRLIDPSVVENQVWSNVEMDKVLEKLDLSDTKYVDEPGKSWIARTHSTVFEVVD